MFYAISSGSCPILFRVLTLNVAICSVCLHFSSFDCLSSVADFSNTEARAPTSSSFWLLFTTEILGSFGGGLLGGGEFISFFFFFFKSKRRRSIWTQEPTGRNISILVSMSLSPINLKCWILQNVMLYFVCEIMLKLCVLNVKTRLLYYKAKLMLVFPKSANKAECFEFLLSNN